MGKIKTKLIRRTSKALVEKGVEFSESFEKNKKVLKDTMPSKKMRNWIAGYLSRVKKQEQKKNQVMTLNK